MPSNLDQTRRSVGARVWWRACLLVGALLVGFALPTYAASGDNAVPGVKVTVGSQSQTGTFAPGVNEVSLTFDVSNEPSVQALVVGQSTALEVTAVVYEGLLPGACGCTANELAQQVKIAGPVPAPVPSLGAVALMVLAALVLALALRRGVGKRGLKALAAVGLGMALLHPVHELRAAAGDALDSMTVNVTGKTVTVIVKRNPACVVNLAPTWSSNPIIFSMPDGGGSYVMPAAVDDIPGTVLTYSMTSLPTGWAFDPETRQLSWPDTYFCRGINSDNPFAMGAKPLPYTVSDGCNSVTVNARCGNSIHVE